MKAPTIKETGKAPVQLRTVIVEDEPNIRQYLRHLLETHFPAVEIVGEAGSVADAHAIITEASPDLLLLDIQLGDATAFDLLESLHDFRCLVIFVTGYHEFAVRAFEVNAIHYLLKPVTVPALSLALEKAREQLELQAARPLVAGLAQLLKEVEKSQTHITIADRSARHRIRVADIEFGCSHMGCVTLHMTDGLKLLVTKDIGEIQDQFESFNFLRCHQSYIVNGDHVKGSENVDGKFFLVMRGSKKVPVARSNVGWVRKHLNL